MTKKKPEWVVGRLGNAILEGKDFYISFVATSWLKVFGPPSGGETAIVTPSSGGELVYRILNGDFRKEYEAVFPDLKKCIEIYEKNQDEYGSIWSTIL